MSLVLERIYVGFGLWGLFAIVTCTPIHRCDDVTFPNWLWIIRICRRERERKKSSAAKSMARGVKRWGRGIRRSEDNRILTPDDRECRAGSNPVLAEAIISRWRARTTKSGPGLRVSPFERAGSGVERIENSVDVANEDRAVDNDRRRGERDWS